MQKCTNIISVRVKENQALDYLCMVEGGCFYGLKKTQMSISILIVKNASIACLNLKMFDFKKNDIMIIKRNKGK